MSEPKFSSYFPVHAEDRPLTAAEALEDCVTALGMVLYGVYLPFGAPAIHADGCTEAEAHEACSEAFQRAHAVLAALRFPMPTTETDRPGGAS